MPRKKITPFNDEFDLKLGRISVDSPVARALLGKFEGDEVTVKAPGGTTTVTILTIEYEDVP